MPYHTDPVWEEKYSHGHQQRYPWDAIVSFVYRASKNKEHKEVSILEVGCGTGGNLWFAAREGFQVFGIDGSDSAIQQAQRRFLEEGLTGQFRVGDLAVLPFEPNSFDIVIDRGAITCVGYEHSQKSIQAIFQVLKPGGQFFFSPYATDHSSFKDADRLENGLCQIKSGSLMGFGQLCFYDR